MSEKINITLGRAKSSLKKKNNHGCYKSSKERTKSRIPIGENWKDRGIFEKWFGDYEVLKGVIIMLLDEHRYF